MELKVGYRVTSSEVEPLGEDGTYQDRILEIYEFLDNNKVRCIYFSERVVNPERTFYDVNIDSLTFISKEPLKYKGIEKDKFFNKKK